MDYKELNKQAADLYGEDYQEANTTISSETTTKSDFKLSILKNRKLLIKLSVVLIIVVLLTALASALYVPGYEKPIKKSINLINRKVLDITEYYALENPFDEYEFDKCSESNYYNSYDKNTELFYTLYIENLEKCYGEDYKITYEIVFADELDSFDVDDYPTIKFNDLLFDLVVNDGEYHKDLELKEAYRVCFNVIISGSEDKQAFLYDTIVLKVNNKWIMDRMFSPLRLIEIYY